MTKKVLRRCAASVACALAFVLAMSRVASISAKAAEQAPGDQRSVRATAPLDLTGYWVSIVTEDWIYRMVTPARGDYAGVPLNAEGRRVADTWDFERDRATGNQCKAYGAAAIMRMPTRVHVMWQDDNTLKLEMDAGQQTRLFHFGSGKPTNLRPTLQGYSLASWYFVDGRGEVPPEFNQAGPSDEGEGPRRQQGRGGQLKVVTTDMTAGYLRKNGVPSSDAATVTEYFFRHHADGEWFTVTTIVDDPKYLGQRFVTSTHFRQEADGSKWNPTPCDIAPPIPR